MQKNALTACHSASMMARLHYFFTSPGPYPSQSEKEKAKRHGPEAACETSLKVSAPEQVERSPPTSFLAFRQRAGSTNRSLSSISIRANSEQILWLPSGASSSERCHENKLAERPRALARPRLGRRRLQHRAHLRRLRRLHL